MRNWPWRFSSTSVAATLPVHHAHTGLHTTDNEGRGPNLAPNRVAICRSPLRCRIDTDSAVPHGCGAASHRACWAQGVPFLVSTRNRCNTCCPDGNCRMRPPPDWPVGRKQKQRGPRNARRRTQANKRDDEDDCRSLAEAQPLGAPQVPHIRKYQIIRHGNQQREKNQNPVQFTWAQAPKGKGMTRYNNLKKNNTIRRNNKKRELRERNATNRAPLPESRDTHNRVSGLALGAGDAGAG